MDSVTSERLLFRKITSNDFEKWLPFHKDKRTSEFWSGLPKNPIEACHQDFDRTLFRYENNLGGKLALINKSNGEFIGLCGLLVQKVNNIKEIEIAYSLLPEYWYKGFATEAAQKCKIYAIENKLAKSLISIIHIDNKPSQKIAQNNLMNIDKTTTYNNNPVHIFRVHI
ncbi:MULTISPECIES: GNAT family N-acetyltransferase [Cellulophaga]|uniref:GNAT family N-acetyltransferase n=1 Tax=Cellulophaga TaxID=104264 RepID=UPI00209132EB|nr:MULTISPECIES: GNAT family N-acetyltransferase [Cellulophaga]MDO6768368.1 GNAT family N-acetyltransferase [Cellulophaga sp. 1_MG-2023]